MFSMKSVVKYDFLLLVVLFALPTVAQETPGIEKEILQTNRDMELAFNNKDYTAVAAFYDDEAILVTDSYETEGREAIDKYWMGMDGRGISWRLENIEIIPDVDTAVQRGISHLKYRDREGNEVVSRVKFTLLWMRTDDRWKIRIDHYSSL